MTATPPQSPWSRLLQRLDPTVPIDLGTTDKGASINRAFDAQMQRAIWDKRYELKADDHRLAYRVFSKWENTLIAQLKDKGVRSGPLFVAMEQRASPIHTGATAMQDRKTGKSLLRTYDLGPDLDVWNRLRPCIQGIAKPLVLYRASDLLRLARATLLALKDLHDHGFVHCDLHAGNVALPCRITNQTPDKNPHGPSLTVQPLWDELRIFDLDASLSQHGTPPVVPYLSTDPAKMPRMSNHLRLRLSMLYALAESKGENAYDEPFWARHLGNGGRDLQCLQRVDWREDLHQLGHLFEGLLENEIEYDHPNQEFLLEELVTEWTAWGGPEQLDGLKTSDLQKQPKESQSAYYERLRKWVERIEKLPTPAKPHDGYLARLDAMLRKHPSVGSGVWVFRREDNDAGYAAERNQEALNNAVVSPELPKASFVERFHTWGVESVSKLGTVLGFLLDGISTGIGYLLVPFFLFAEVISSIWPDFKSDIKTVLSRGSGWVVSAVSGVFGFAAAIMLGATSILLVTAGAKYAWNYSKDLWQSWGNPFQNERKGLAETTEKYHSLSTRIQAGTWFTTGKETPNQEERDWIKQTQSLAVDPGLPPAQFNLAQLYCSGIGGTILPRNTAACGEWLSRVLTTADAHNSTPKERDAYLDSTAKVFDSFVWTAKRPDSAFARAVAPGLQAVQDERPGLANRLALVQACYQTKPDPALARSTLQRTLEKHPQADTAADTRALMGLQNLCLNRS